MIKHLNIQNFTLIKHLDLEFHSGMTVITGESGAGKSIIINAISLALGGRASKNLVKPNEKYCHITLSLDLKNLHSAQKWLQENCLDLDNHICTLRRTLFQDGRSRCFINDNPVSVQQLKSLSQNIIEIHGQHQHQSLLTPKKHQKIFDLYAKNLDLLKNLFKIYAEYTEQNNLLTNLLNNNISIQQKSFLEYQIQELEQYDLENSTHQINYLETEYKKLEQSRTHQKICVDLINFFKTQANQTQLAKSLEHLENYYPQVKNILELLTQSNIYQTEAEAELQDLFKQINVNPESLSSLSQKIQALHDLARKHQITPEELPELHNKLNQELENLNQAANQILELQNNLQNILQSYQIIADQLSENRHSISQIFEKKVSSMLNQLGMPHGEIKLNFTPVNNIPNPNGNETIEFLVKTNPAQEFQALNKIASGGELSRISLAIDVLTAKKELTPCLIFDEVDVGIGGETANIVGKLLQNLSQNTQLICITHLPQVAAFADNHIQVSKNIDIATDAVIKQLDSQEKIQELARMLGGQTESARAHARELVTG